MIPGNEPCTITGAHVHQLGPVVMVFSGWVVVEVDPNQTAVLVAEEAVAKRIAVLLARHGLTDPDVDLDQLYRLPAARARRPAWFHLFRKAHR